MTAERAAGLPAVVLFLLTGLFAIAALTAQVRCVDAARDAALAAARGSPDPATALRYAPEGARLSVDTGADLVQAEVTTRVRPWGNWLPAIEVGGTATAAIEPGGPP